MGNTVVLYQTPKGNVSVNVVFKNESFWLTQKTMAELFGVEVPAISKHLNNIYETGELEREATISILETVQKAETEAVVFYALIPIRQRLD